MRCIYVFVQALSPCIFQVCKIKQMYFAVSYLTIQDIAVLQYFSCEFDTYLTLSYQTVFNYHTSPMHTQKPSQKLKF